MPKEDLIDTRPTPVNLPSPQQVQKESTFSQYEKIDTKLDKISEAMARMQTREEVRDKAINSLEHAVFGVGSVPGLRMDIQTVKNKFQAIDKDITSLDEKLAEIKTDVQKGFSDIKEEMQSRKKLFINVLVSVLSSGAGAGAVIKLIELLNM